jgi:phosphate/sulfate permease
MPRTLLLLTLLAFGALSAAALWQHGYWGILAPHFQTFGGAQVLVDLVIALTLFMVWMWQDARATGRNVWPWIVLTLLGGSFGPLLYLLTRQPRPRAT